MRVKYRAQCKECSWSGMAEKGFGPSLHESIAEHVEKTGHRVTFHEVEPRPRRPRAPRQPARVGDGLDDLRDMFRF